MQTIQLVDRTTQIHQQAGCLGVTAIDAPILNAFAANLGHIRVGEQQRELLQASLNDAVGQNRIQPQGADARRRHHVGIAGDHQF